MCIADRFGCAAIGQPPVTHGFYESIQTEPYEQGIAARDSDEGNRTPVHTGFIVDHAVAIQHSCSVEQEILFDMPSIIVIQSFRDQVIGQDDLLQRCPFHPAGRCPPQYRPVPWVQQPVWRITRWTPFVFWQMHDIRCGNFRIHIRNVTVGGVDQIVRVYICESQENICCAPGVLFTSGEGVGEGEILCRVRCMTTLMDSRVSRKTRMNRLISIRIPRLAAIHRDLLFRIILAVKDHILRILVVRIDGPATLADDVFRIVRRPVIRTVHSGEFTLGTHRKMRRIGRGTGHIGSRPSFRDRPDLFYPFHQPPQGFPSPGLLSTILLRSLDIFLRKDRSRMSHATPVLLPPRAIHHLVNIKFAVPTLQPLRCHTTSFQVFT